MEDKLGIENIKQFVGDAIALVAGAKELFQRGKKPNLLKRMLAGAKAIDLGYDMFEVLPKVKAEIADLSEAELSMLIAFVRTEFKAEGSDADVKFAIAVSVDAAIAFYKSVQQVGRLLKTKEEEEKVS